MCRVTSWFWYPHPPFPSALVDPSILRLLEIRSFLFDSLLIQEAEILAASSLMKIFFQISIIQCFNLHLILNLIVNRDMEKHSTSRIVKNEQIKTILRYHYAFRHR